MKVPAQHAKLYVLGPENSPFLKVVLLLPSNREPLV